MRWIERLMAVGPGLVMVLALCAAVPLRAAELAVGDLAPDFQLAGTDGKEHRLADFRGKQAVVLAWYPKAYTSGCTIECKSLAEKGHLIREYDVSYFMASVDPLEDNAGFAAETKADFPLLSDPTKETARKYGVLADFNLALEQTPADNGGVHPSQGGVGKKIPEDQAGQQIDGVVDQRKPEQGGEGHGQDDHGQQGIEEGPEYPQDRPFVPGLEAVADQQGKQIPVLEDLPNFRHHRGADGRGVIIV